MSHLDKLVLHPPILPPSFFEFVRDNDVVMVILYMYFCCMIARACDDNMMLLSPGTSVCAAAAPV